ncbi:MAG: Hsp20/alpha crystallin family protein [Cytophagales bacterium]|nr:Hsp20/alpha crystallin family protein [Cytophagales bacterium]
MLNDFGTFTGQDSRSSVPAVNIRETEGEYQLEVAAPGLNKEQFSVNVEDRVLTVSAEQKKEETQENGKWTRREFSYASFKRSFTLPKNVNAEAIKATYDNGVLHVHVPKAEAVRPKQIEIQ